MNFKYGSVHLQFVIREESRVVVWVIHTLSSSSSLGSESCLDYHQLAGSLAVEGAVSAWCHRPTPPCLPSSPCNLRQAMLCETSWCTLERRTECCSTLCEPRAVANIQGGCAGFSEPSLRFEEVQPICPNSFFLTLSRFSLSAAIVPALSLFFVSTHRG